MSVSRIGAAPTSPGTVFWGTSILGGVFEEIPFRGFVLQKLQERFDFVTSMVIQQKERARASQDAVDVLHQQIDGRPPPRRIRAGPPIRAEACVHFPFRFFSEFVW